MPYTTVAVVKDVLQAHAVSDDLHAAGFPSGTISVVFPERYGRELRQHLPAARTLPPAAPPAMDACACTMVVAEPCVEAGGDLATTPMPGSGRFLASGPILAILSGLGIRSAPDGMVRSLTGMGLAESDALHFTTSLDAGQILVAVRTDEESCSLLVAEILRHHGGRDISRSAWPRMTPAPIDPA